MAITVQCPCGRRTTVGDPLAGKSIRCPQCGQSVAVGAAAAPVGKTPSRASAPPRGAAAQPRGPTPLQMRRQAAVPVVHIESGLLIKGGIAAALVGLILLAYFGPVRVWNQWEQIGPKAQNDISDVVSFALQAYMSQNGMFDPGKTRNQPGVVSNIGFFRPFLSMTMPDAVKFFGRTNQGPFQGTYNPRNGEINANISYGAVSHLAFGSDTGVKETVAGSFQITGREQNGAPEAEMNGTKLTIYFPPKDAGP
jgi:hypothetical protein